MSYFDLVNLHKPIVRLLTLSGVLIHKFLRKKLGSKADLTKLIRDKHQLLSDGSIFVLHQKGRRAHRRGDLRNLLHHRKRLNYVLDVVRPLKRHDLE